LLRAGSLLRKTNGKVKVNDRTPPSRRSQLRGNPLHPDQFPINRADEYTVAFFN